MSLEPIEYYYNKIKKGRHNLSTIFDTVEFLDQNFPEHRGRHLPRAFKDYFIDTMLIHSRKRVRSITEWADLFLSFNDGDALLSGMLCVGNILGRVVEMCLELRRRGFHPDSTFPEWGNKYDDIYRIIYFREIERIEKKFGEEYPQEYHRQEQIVKIRSKIDAITKQLQQLRLGVNQYVLSQTFHELENTITNIC